MKAIGYVRVSTDRQAEQGVSLEAQEAKIRAMATVQGAELLEVIIDGGESAKNLNRPGLQRLLTQVDSGKVEAVIVAKLDRLTRSVKDLCSLLELFEKRSVALVSVAESLDTASAAGRLVITIMAAVRPWRAGCAHGNPSPAPERPHDARDCGSFEPQGAADAPWFRLAAGARGANHQTGNRPSLIAKSSGSPGTK